LFHLKTEIIISNMHIISQVLIVIVVLLHLYFLWLEMFVWTTKAYKVFRNFPKDLFEKTKTMAANQGLYNGFLAAGLIWSLFITDFVWSNNIALFFLTCVTIAGIYGAYSVSKKIFFVQGIPAILGILSLIFVR
jgi:putative membrane protein